MAFTKDRVTIADGKYDARWSAYTLQILGRDEFDPSKRFVIATVKTETGVKGINCPVKVTVKDGKVFPS
jgi:hypothetical protein